MLKIPKIIHQTWKDDQPPRLFQALSQTWRDMLPGWEYKLWTDEMNHEFVRTHYPEFLENYDAYPKNIQRADAIRYLLLQTYGGLYVDLDFECLKREFTLLLEDADFVAGKEPYDHARRYGRKHIICNALMASVPNHPFLEHIIARMMSHPHGWDVRYGGDILDSTGPFLLTDAYKSFKNKEGIRIFESEFLYPIRLGESKLIMQNNVPEEMQRRINTAYAIHYFYGTWWE
jgi:mannosyltransferase OCH1-like enzyme